MKNTKKLLGIVLALIVLTLVMSISVFAADTSNNNLYVNCDYNSSTEGWGVTHFSNYAGAYAYATVNNKTATIVIEKTNTLSGNTFDNNHKNYSKLAVVIKDGATMGNALSKWDMTYPVTVEPGGTLTCARPKTASVSNIHIKNTLTVGAQGATEKAVVDFLSDSYQDCDISIRYNGKILVYNSDFRVQDLDAQGALTIEGSDVYVDGAFASATFFATTLTDSTMTVKGNQISGGLSDFAGGTSNQLGNVKINNSTLTIEEGTTKVAANVTVTNSTLSVNDLTVNNGKKVNLDDGSTLVAESVTLNGTASVTQGENAQPLYVAKVGTSAYATLGEAIAALKDGETLVILKGFTAGANEFIELNGKKNITISAAEGVVIDGSIEVGYHPSHVNYGSDVDGTFTVKNLTVNGTLTIYSNNANLVVEDNNVAQLTVKIGTANANIVIDGNTADSSKGEAKNGYGMFIIPNATAYDLTVSDNTFKNISGHAFVIQGGGDGNVATAANSIAFANNTFDSWGLGGKSNRAAIKIWNDSKYAPADGGAVTEAMKELVWAVTDEAAGNKFKSTASNTVEFDAYGVAGDGDVIAPSVTYVATVNGEGYATLYEAVMAAQNGEKIVLLSDADLDFANHSGYKYVRASEIDLNGKTLTVKSGDIRLVCTTIKNGSVVVDPTCNPYSRTAVFVAYSSSYAFDTVNFTATGISGTAILGLEGTGSSLNITNSVFTIDNENAVALTSLISNYSDGVVVIEDSDITVKNINGRACLHGSYVVKGESTIVASGVKAGFYIGAGKSLTINDTSEVTVDNLLSGYTDGIYLGDATAVYTKAETATVNSTVTSYVTYVAEVNGVGYATLADALAAANNGDTITLIWAEGDAPIAMNGSVYGKSVTITGTATVDWSKGFLFIGRGGEGNGTVIFDNANLTSASNDASYGIHVSGREKNTNNKYDGTLIINNSTIVLDYLINKGNMTLDNNSTLTVKNGFAIGGRPASETESGADATATITLNNGSKVVVNNHNGMGLGYEAIGVMYVNGGSTFECTQAFLVTAKGTLNVNGGEIKIAGNLTNNGTINVGGTVTLNVPTVSGNTIYANNGAVINASTIGGTLFANGNIEFKGANKVNAFNAGWYNHVITIGANASLEVTGTGRVTVGYGNVFNIIGTIADAKNTDKSTVTPSLVIPGGLSITGSGATFNVVNAYVQLGLSTSKNSGANNTFDFDFTNSIVDFSNNFSFATSTNGMTPTFDIDVKDSVLNLSKNFDLSNAACDVLVDNSTITVGSSMRNDGKLELINGSKLIVNSQIQPDEHGGNNGEIIVDNSALEIYCSTVGHAVVGGKLVLKNNATASIDYIKETAVELGIGATLTTNSNDLTVTTDPAYEVVYKNGMYATVKAPVAQIGDVKYTSLYDAMVAAKAGETVKLLCDVDLTGTEWEPVSFKGNFDGQNFKISNLTINKPGVSNVGFIASLNGSFKNVTFVNPTVTGGENTGVVAGRAGGSAALAENITVTGTIKVETTHSGYARAGVIVGGWGYGNYKNITVDGLDKATSYIKHTGGGDGRYVAGIVGHADEVESFINCTVKNITISGGWLCGGITGPGPADGLVSDCAVEDINVNADYSGGMFGWYYGSGTIKDSSVKNVEFTAGTTANGAIGGYSNNTSAKLENVTFENVTNQGAPLIEHVAKIGEAYYTSLADAFAAAKNGDEVKILVAGTYALSVSGKNITVTGAVNGVVFDNIGAYNMGGANVTFNNVTFDYYPNNNYTGLQHSGDLVYNNCTFNGMVFLYGTSETFNKCTFNQNSADAYNVWTYGAKKVAFNECTFNCVGKAVLVYNETSSVTNDVAITKSTFNASAPVDGKAAIEIDTSLTAGANITIDAATTATGFANGNVSGNSLWNNKKGNNTDANNDVTVVVGDKTVLAPVTFVAKIGNIGYTSLADAIAAIGSGDVVIELLADATLDYNARDAYGLADTASVTINGNGHILTLNQKNSDWASIGLANAGAKLVLNDMTINKTGYGATSGAWNTHAIIFKCNVEMTDAIVNNSVAVQNGATLNNVTINEANGYYGLWVNANGQSVTMNGGAINATNGGRGIKIADQYVDNVKQVKLDITGTKFTTANKAAVLVTSPKGANITASNVDITNVAADNTSLVWVDETYAANFGKVEVTGATVAQESIEEFVASVIVNGKVEGYYKTLAEALAALKAGDTLTLLADAEINTSIVVTSDLTIDGNGHKITVTGAYGIDIQAAGVDLVINNLTIKSNLYALNMRGVSDNSTVEINDSNLTGCIALNVWGENVVITANNSNFTSVDNATHENYAAVVLNNNGSVSAEGTVITINGGTITALDENKNPSSAATNSTATGKFNISDTTVVTGKIKEIVAIVTYSGQDPFYSCFTLQAAIDRAANDATATVKLLRNITVNEALVINGNVVIDGNGKTLTYTGKARAIDVPNTVANANVTIKNLTIDFTSGYSERGINYNTNGTLTLDNVTINGKDVTYAVNFPGSSNDAKVVINNSNIIGKIALNVWGKNMTITVTDTALTSVDNATHENYAAVALNNNGSVSAEGTVITINGGTITALDENKKPSIAVRNATATGKINISNETVVTGEIEEIVAIVTYNGYSEFYSCFTLQAAIDKAANDATATVKLLCDITVNEALEINGKVVIDLNGKKVTSTAKRAFEVYADATIKNGTIVGANRCVDTRTAVKLTLEDLALVAENYTSSYRNPQPLTIGGSVNGTKVTMSNVNINAGKSGYGIISFVETDLTAENCTITGYAALYVKAGSEGSEFTFEGCTLTGDNTNNDVEGNSFAAIALQANDITVTVDKDSTINAKGNNMYAIAVGSTSIDVTGNTVTVSGTINGNIIATDDYDNTVKVKAEYADELVNAGYSASEADENGLVTVEKDEIPTLTKAETALLLEENFKMSFYFPVDQFVDGVNYFAMITKHHVDTCGDPDEITYVAIDMTKIYDADNYGASYRVVADNIAAKEMNCEISCQVFAGEMPENVNDENTAVSIGTVKDSIYEYAMWQLENSNDEKLKALIVDVLNYGAAAQKYFNHYETVLANRGLTDEQKDSSVLPEGYVYQKVTKMYGPHATEYVGVSSALILEASVHMILDLVDMDKLVDPTVVVEFTHNGESAKQHHVVYRIDDEEHPLIIDANGVARIIVDDLAAVDAQVTVHCSVYDGEATAENLLYTVDDSVESYCGWGVSTSDAELAAVCERIIKYSQSAKAYFNK